MPIHSSPNSARLGYLSAVLALSFLSMDLRAQNAPPPSDTPSNPTYYHPPQQQAPPPTNTQNPTGVAPKQPPKQPPQQPQQPPSRGGRGGPTSGTSINQTPPPRQPPPREGHPGETNPGSTPHSSVNGPAVAGAAIGAGVIISELIAHHNQSPQTLGHNGPQVPHTFDMSGFAIKGLVRPNWPIVLDYMTDAPGAAVVDIIAADKHHFRATIHSNPNRRGYGTFRLPPNFGDRVQIAVYHVYSVPDPGYSTPPHIRAYGMGAGDRAVGSVAIDQLVFQPPTIHPQAKEVANFGFHAHSAFDKVQAEFVFTTLHDGKLLVQKDEEKKLDPIPEGERARGTWEGKGKSGEHMLQIRAWRGIENGGDWVVAWSPDIVDVVK